MIKESKEIFHASRIKATAGKTYRKKQQSQSCLKTGRIFLIALKDLIYFCSKRRKAALPFQEILPFL